MATSTANDADKNVSHGDYLSDQASDATKAIGVLTDRLKKHLGEAADPKAWTRDHPMAWLGGAAAVGFLAGAALLGKHKAPPAPTVKSNGKRSKPAPAKPGLLSTLIHELIGIAKPAITTAIMTQLGLAKEHQAQAAGSGTASNGKTSDSGGSASTAPMGDVSAAAQI
jgi:ElaB/YqjD/DUF883 family membrane-anchored ribosome-binding protein